MAGKYGPGGLQDSMANMSLSGGNGPSQAASGPQGSSSQSRLGLWTDKAPGSRQGAPAASNMSSPLHASHSTPNLQGLCFLNLTNSLTLASMLSLLTH